MKAEPKWYVAQVLTGSEAETARRLTEAGMEAIAPVQVLHERRHGVWRLMRRTVFPGYVFVRVALIPRTYYHIQRQPQVVRLLGGAARRRCRKRKWQPCCCSRGRAGTSASPAGSGATARP